MKKLYEKNEFWFAILWIVAYCVISIPIRGSFGDESIAMLIGLAVIAIGILAFVKKYHLEEKYGLTKWRGNAKDYLYFLPMLILMTENLWGGVGHIVNLFAGQGSMESLIQVFFAIAWGFIFTFVFYESGSLWVCIIVHGLVDVFLKFAAMESNSDYTYTIATIIV